MIRINTGDHRAINPLWRAIPKGNRHMLTWLRDRTCRIARHLPSADAYFKRLPFQKTLTSLVADSRIWLSYEDNPSRFGVTSTCNHTDIVISSTAFRQGRWVVSATLVHELAHVAGAPGLSHAAEQAVPACGPGRPGELDQGRNDPRTPDEPGIIGTNMHGRELAVA